MPSSLVSQVAMPCSRCGRSVALCVNAEVDCVDGDDFTVDEESGTVICRVCWLEAEICGCGDEA
jgi:hypothetical protein